MANPELGSKRVCVACGARFYGRGNVPAVCPRCGTEQPSEAPRPRRSGGNIAEDKRLKKSISGPGAEDRGVEVEGMEEVEEENVLEDASDLEDDTEGIGPDIEVEQDNDETDR